MCRHLCYLGDPKPLRELLLDPPSGLFQQRRDCADASGFGLGWYAGDDPAPAGYRSRGPIGADPDLPELVRATRCGAFVAVVGEAGPYRAQRWLFSRAGGIDGPLEAISDLIDSSAGTAPPDVEAHGDGALLWALVLRRLRDGATAADALAGVVADVTARTPARLNLMLTDGRSVAATVYGEPLGYRVTAQGVLVASEPPDGEGGWTRLDDATLLTATRDGVETRPLAGPRPAASGAPAGTRRARPAADRAQDGGLLTVERRLPADFRSAQLRADVLRGLTAVPKWLPPKWFYDARGSELFDEITRLPEYYPTRAESEILTDRAAAIAAASGAHTLIELGAGSARKTRLLLDALLEAGSLAAYLPTDVSESALTSAAHALRRDYPDLPIHAVVTDFEHPLAPPAADGPRLVAFLGGTIGNLPPADRARFLAALRADLDPGDWLLLGTDLVKDPATLVAAYDDAAGVTARFNKNVLLVLNRELGADFDPDGFDHVALWDAGAEWIEMRLRANRAQTVKVPALDLGVDFEAGEELRTEISAKFRPRRVEAELAEAGFKLREWWTDTAGRFGLSLSSAR